MASVKPRILLLFILSLLMPSYHAYPSSYDQLQSLLYQSATFLSSSGQLLGAADSDNTTKILKLDGYFKPLATLGNHSATVTSVDISTSDNKILTGGLDEVVNVWQLTGGQYELTQNIEVGMGVDTVKFSADESTFLVGGDSASVLVFAYDTDQYKQKQALGTFERVVAVAIDHNASRIFASSSSDSEQSTIWIWNNDTQLYQQLHNLTSSVTSAAWSSDSSALFLAHGNDVEIYAYNNETNKYEEALKLQDHNDTVQAVVLSRDDKWLASAGNSQHLVIYNWNGTDYVKFADKKPVDSAIQGLSITADGGLISSSYVADQQSQNSLVYQYGIDCSGDTHSIGRATPTSCNCANHFVWNTTQSLCYVDCASDKHSTGTSTDFETCGCNDMFEWNNSTSLCEVPCDRDPNSNGTNSDAQTCICNAKYVWNDLKLKCYFNCLDIEKSTGTNKDENTCDCVNQYLWHDQDCWFDCKQDEKSTGTNIDINTCECVQDYAWDPATLKCVYFLDCTKDQHSTGQNFDNESCICVYKYWWVKEQRRCELNCQMDRNSNGTNTGVDSCYCKSHFVWNQDLELCGIDCSQDANSNHSNKDALSCFCNMNYHWNSYLSECIYWFECSKDPNSQGINIDNETCLCLSNFKWNSASHLCVIQCSDPNSNGMAASATSCFCNTGYEWEADSKSCKSAGSDSTTIIILAVVIGLLVLFAAFLVVRGIRMRKRMQASLIVNDHTNTDAAMD